MSLALAMLIDRWLGEPPPRTAPCRLDGVLSRVDRQDPAGKAPGRRLHPRDARLARGRRVGGGGVRLRAGARRPMPAWLVVLATALLLKPLFALRMLLVEVGAVEHALGESLARGRSRLRRIVSRDTTRLDAGEVRESALESFAENLSDSVVAPLFWFALFGLPGAAVYRFANTADAMWGYHGRWEWAGKFAARADDLLNLIPARITALALSLTARRPGQVLRRLPREAARTPSPNSGWPMAALALSSASGCASPASMRSTSKAQVQAPRTSRRRCAAVSSLPGCWRQRSPHCSRRQPIRSLESGID